MLWGAAWPLMMAWSARSVITSRSDDRMLMMLHLLFLAYCIWLWISLRRASRPRMMGPPGIQSCHTASSDIIDRIFSTSGLDVSEPSPHAAQNSRMKFSWAIPIVILLGGAPAATAGGG